jgi:hypothetical protein
VSRSTRVVNRTIEERIPIEICEGCGTQVDLGEPGDHGLWQDAPGDWMLLLTAEYRRLARGGQIAHETFCSWGCLERFAAAHRRATGSAHVAGSLTSALSGWSDAHDQGRHA